MSHSFIPSHCSSSQPVITVLSAAHSAKQLCRLSIFMHLFSPVSNSAAVSVWLLCAFLWVPFQPPYFLNFLLNQYTWFSLSFLPVCTSLLQSSVCSPADVCTCVLFVLNWWTRRESRHFYSQKTPMKICQKAFSVISVHVCVREGAREIKKKKFSWLSLSCSEMKFIFLFKLSNISKERAREDIIRMTKNVQITCCETHS